LIFEEKGIILYMEDLQVLIKEIKELLKEGLSPVLTSTMSKYPPLTPQKEKELFLSLQSTKSPSKKKEIHDTIVKHNLRLVNSIALKYSSMLQGEIGNIFQEGVFGLDRAIEKFDVSRGLKFSTIATFWIKDAITRVLGKEISRRQKEDIIDKIDQAISKREHPEESLIKKLDVQRILQTLPKREAEIMNLKWLEGWTYEEIGKKLGYSGPRILQIERKTLENLKDKFRRNM